MFKKSLIISLVLGLSITLTAQNNVDFVRYFGDATLRIHYVHAGNAVSEQIILDSYHSGKKWNGTRAFLVEPYRYGDILFEVFDYQTNVPIFIYSYNSLFNEYRATERAQTETASFEEAVLLPMPKQKIRYAFTVYTRDNRHQLLFENTFDPATDKTIPFARTYTTINLHTGGKPDESLDILFIPEGYALTDKKKMQADMKRFAKYIMNCSPYKENAKKINIKAINAFSEESGVTNPNEKIYKKTLLNCSYNTIDVDRYLMCLNVWKLHEIAANSAYDLIIIVVNSSKYGGGGIYNFYCTVNNEGQYSDYVMVHELGHLLGGLADEYYTSEVSVQDFYPADVEPREPNITTLVDFESKWQSMLDPKVPLPTPNSAEYQNTLGLFEGGGYVATGVYRPWLDCTMKEKIYNNFCPVCSRTINNIINYYAIKYKFKKQ